MLRKTRVAVVLSAVGALGVSGCGGEPFHEKRSVPTVAMPEPPMSTTPPSAARTSSPAKTTSEQAPTTTTSNPPTASSSTDDPPATASPRSTSTPAPSTPRPSTTSEGPPPAVTKTPRTSASSAPTKTPSAPPRGEPTTLDTMGGPGSGPVSIAGTRYPNSFSVSSCTVFSTQPTYAFDLGGRYARLSGVVGQDDGSASKDAVLTLTIRGDGRTLASKTVRHGQAVPTTVEVSGVKRLTLSFTEVSCGSDGAALAYGSARVQ